MNTDAKELKLRVSRILKDNERRIERDKLRKKREAERIIAGRAIES